MNYQTPQQLQAVIARKIRIENAVFKFLYYYFILFFLVLVVLGCMHLHQMVSPLLAHCTLFAMFTVRQDPNCKVVHVDVLGSRDEVLDNMCFQYEVWTRQKCLYVSTKGAFCELPHCETLIDHQGLEDYSIGEKLGYLATVALHWEGAGFYSLDDCRLVGNNVLDFTRDEGFYYVFYPVHSLPPIYTGELLRVIYNERTNGHLWGGDIPHRFSRWWPELVFLKGKPDENGVFELSGRCYTRKGDKLASCFYYWFGGVLSDRYPAANAFGLVKYVQRVSTPIINDDAVNTGAYIGGAPF
jgi:hypothetical protein